MYFEATWTLWARANTPHWVLFGCLDPVAISTYIHKCTQEHGLYPYYVGTITFLKGLGSVLGLVFELITHQGLPVMFQQSCHNALTLRVVLCDLNLTYFVGTFCNFSTN